jgi:hypothetical protein
MTSQAGTSKAAPLDISKPFATSRPRAASKSHPKSAADPILRNALRYTISAREYESLHKYVLSRSRVLRRRVPSVNTVDKYMDGGADSRENETGKGKGKAVESTPSPNGNGGDTYNARAIRHALRVFVATGIGIKAYEVIMARLKGQKEYVSLPAF